MVRAERMQLFKNGKSRTKGRVNKIHDCYMGNKLELRLLLFSY